MKNTKVKTYSPLKFLCLASLVAFLLQVYGTVMHIIQPLNFQYIPSSFSQAIFESYTILSGIAFFVLAHVLLNVILILILYFISKSMAKLFKLTDRNTTRVAIALWSFTFFTLLLANQIFYPWSVFSFLPQSVNLILLYKIILAICLIIYAAIILLALIPPSRFLLKRKSIMISLVFIALIGTSISYVIPKQQHPIAATKKPNIIIFSIDAMRPDYTGFENGTSYTPHMDKFLKTATIFTNSYTPLARTYPAWMSLLTGEYPKTNGIRYNLTDPSHVNFSDTLPSILNKQGYTTIFASDGRQFNTMGHIQGFSKIISIPTGFNNFILSSANDFPLSNLIVNTKLGEWLFPYSYANRDMGITYNPKTYVTFFKDKLGKINHRPVFIVIHLGLAHWPFIWENAKKYNYPPISEAVKNTQYSYKTSLKRVDLQFSRIIKVLKQNHLLDHALMFVISDHGSGLGFNNERVTQYRYMKGKKPINNKDLKALQKPTYGHGTDILNMKQYHPVIAFRAINLDKKNIARKISSPTVLIDIKPTILSFLNYTYKSEGINLAPYIFNKNPPDEKTRNIFIESGFTFKGLQNARPNIQDLLKEGLHYFILNPKTGQLTINATLGKLIIEGKQRAVIRYPWILALYPITHSNKVVILGNLKTKQWTTDLDSAFAKHAPVEKLTRALQLFYGKEVTGLLKIEEKQSS